MISNLSLCSLDNIYFQFFQKIIVFCRAGHSRSPTIVIAYLMKYENMTFDEAYKYVKNKRNIMPNNGFIEQLHNYEKLKLK